MPSQGSASKRLSLVLLVGSFFEQLSVSNALAAPQIAKHYPQPVVHSSSAGFDAFGMPTKKLESLLRSNHSRQARILLTQTPRHENDEDARKIWLAACLSKEEKYDEAVAELRKVKHVESANGYALYLAAMAYTQAQEFEKAKEISNIAIKRDNCHECYEIRATCNIAEKRYVEAAADYEKAAIYSKSHASDFYCEAAGALLKANQPSRALALVDKASPLQNASLHGSLLLTKGICLERLGRWTDAVAVLSKEISTRRSNQADTTRFWLTSSLKERAKCYDQLGRTAEAAADRKTLDSMSGGLANDLLGK